MTGILVRCWRPVRRGARQRLDARLFIIGDRHFGRFLQRAFQQFRVTKTHLSVPIQNLHHHSLNIRRDALYIIADFVRLDLTSLQNPVQFGTAQCAQAGMARLDAMLANMLLKHRVRPELVRIAQLFGFLTGALQHPRDRIVRNATALARPWKLSQRRLEPELKVFAQTQRNRMAIHSVTAGDGAITHTISGVQKYRGVKYPSLLSTAGTAKTLQLLLLFRRKHQRLPLREEWHKPFWHKNVLMVYLLTEQYCSNVGRGSFPR